ncbi:MAG: glucosamine-6-phosphate deaminase [Opitutus sp.]|nr:glucosamine-6-phosphate deaminase [Opitutus sp.]
MSAPHVEILADRPALGRAAATHVVGQLEKILARPTRARVVFACAPSQDEFLENFVAQSRGRLDWSRITVFHMDEYVGISATHPASFRHYLQTHLLALVTPREFHPLGGDAPDAAAECRRYSALLDAAPIDLICLGIGENGHLAFNDPPVANFDDPVSVKIVELDHTCRQQQVNDGCFPALTAVPTHALSLTIPVFRRARALSVVVPGPRKAAAVRATLGDPIATACPATILRTHAQATLFLDRASAALIA